MNRIQYLFTYTALVTMAASNLYGCALFNNPNTLKKIQQNTATTAAIVDQVAADVASLKIPQSPPSTNTSQTTTPQPTTENQKSLQKSPSNPPL